MTGFVESHVAEVRKAADRVRPYIRRTPTLATDLDPDLRQALVRTIERGALRNAQKMFAIVKTYGRFDLICAIQKYEPIAGPDCRKASGAVKSGESTG